jgi:hypothetical protein
MSAVTIILIVLVVLLIAGLPHWYGGTPYASYGYAPVGIVGVLLVVLLILLLFGFIR